MKVIYSDEDFKTIGTFNNSLFLAGPTPRSLDVFSWRTEALDILEELDFNGRIYCPERKIINPQFDYVSQVEWEWKSMHDCGLIVFWVPRNINTLLGLTTNVEFGRHTAMSNVLYGRPEGAPHTRYLDWLYNKTNRGTPYPTLPGLLDAAMKFFQGKSYICS